MIESLASKSVREMSEAEIGRLLFDAEDRQRLLEEDRQRNARSVAPAFSVFRFCDTSEEGISAILAWLLDARGDHAQGDLFLRAFLAWLHVFWPDTAISRSKAHTEAPIPTRHSTRFIDVLVTSPDGHAMAVENKIGAVDQDQQLSDYLFWLRSHSAGHQLLYLTHDNREPSESSIAAQDRAIALSKGILFERSYSELLDWITKCHELCGASKVRHFIEDFRDHVQKTILGVADMTETERLAAEIAASPSKLNAAFSVFSTEQAVKRMLMAKVVKDIDQEAKSRNWVTLDRDLSTGKAEGGLVIGFSPRPKFGFGIAFYRRDFQVPYFGLTQFRHESISSSKPGAKVMKLLTSIQRCGRGGPTDLWPWWINPSAQNYFFPYGEGFTSEADFWLEVQDGSFAQRIIKSVSELRAHLNNANLLDCLG